jgi:hypothetical protein
MTERALVDESAAPAARAPRPAAPRRGAAESVLELQQRAGNRAVGRMLARAGTGTAPAPAPAFVYPDWSTKDNAEATARATQKRLRTELLPHMVAHANPIVRNTAELFTGPSPLLKLDAITKRSDSDTKFADLDPPGWADPTLYAALFYGTKMDNSQFHLKDMDGTLVGETMYLRGHTSAGTIEGLDDMASTVAHEVSHWFVKQYGELPGTDKDAASFDRYADEFRAYWIEPGGPGAGLTGVAKAEAIRAHLVGTPNDPASGYAELHKAYYKGGDNEFRVEVDLLTGPIGFNVTNSVRLHHLWLLFQARKKGNADVGDIVLWISGLPIAERKEAAASSLVKKLTNELAKEDADRVRAALDSLVSDKFATFMAAIASGKPEDIKKAYTDMTPADRQNAGMNAGFLYNVGKATKDNAVRACVHAMVSTGRVAQYDAMAAFLAALRSARTTLAGSPDAAIPDDVTAALGKLHDYARWTFLSWSGDAVKEYVDSLGPKAAHTLRERLRD